MRIAQFGTPSLPIPASRGGANQKIIYELSKRLAKEHAVHVFSPGRETADFHRDGVSFHQLRGRFDRWPDYLYYFQLFQKARALDFDIVHLHNSSIAALYFQRWQKNVRVVASINYPSVKPNLRIPLLKNLVDPVLARRSVAAVDRLVFISRYSRTLFRRRFRTQPARERVVPSGVDLARYRPSPFLRQAYREQLQLDAKQVILFVGRICEHKGIPVLLDAFRILRERGREIVLVLAGPANDSFDKPGTSRFARWAIARLGDLAGIYVGEPSEEDLIGILNACDALVMPTVKGEMFGMVLVEAMSCGKYVIGSDHGGIPEVIGETGAGRICEAGSARALAAAIGSYFQGDPVDPEIPRRHAQRFDWEAIAAQYTQIYAELAQG